VRTALTAVRERLAEVERTRDEFRGENAEALDELALYLRGKAVALQWVLGMKRTSSPFLA